MNTGNRRRGRESTLQILYQLEAEENAAYELSIENPRGDIIKTQQLLSDISIEMAQSAMARYFEHFTYPEKVQARIRTMVLGIMRHIEEIDALILKHSTKWRLDRMPLVDRNILRIGIFEILHQPDISANVVINEGIEIAKRYGSEESSTFVNGVLDTVAAGQRTEEGSSEEGSTEEGSSEEGSGEEGSSEEGSLSGGSESQPASASTESLSDG